MAIGAIAALGGLQLGSELFRYGAEKRERGRTRDFWKDILRQRQEGPIGQRLQSLFGEFSKRAKEIPGFLKRERAGRLASEYEESMSRFRRNLARSGATRASTVGMEGERGISEGIQRQRELGEFGQVQTEAGLAESEARLGAGIMGQLYPSPGQAAGAYPQQDVTFNPFAAGQGYMSNYMMMSNLFGGGGAGRQVPPVAPA